MSVKCRVLKGGSCEITQFYGVNGHLGTDIVGAGYTLDGIKAHSDGVVSYVQSGYGNAQGSSGMASYGNMLKIKHNNGYETLYAHLDSIYVSNGQSVVKGQDIGYMGNTGNSCGGHLHFEVFKDGVRLNSQDYLDRDFVTLPSPVERSEEVDQIHITCNDTMRIRTSSDVNSEIIGLGQAGYYNIVSIKEATDYIWYELEVGKWVAGIDGVAIYLPKKEKQPEPNVEELQNKVEQLEKANQELIDKNKLLEQENQNLREQDSEFNTFVAPKEGLYGIRLLANEIIKYEKN